MKKTKKNNKSENRKVFENFNGDFAAFTLTHSSFIQGFLEKNKSSLTVEDTECFKAQVLILFQFSCGFSKMLDVEPLIKITEGKTEGLKTYKIEFSDRIAFTPPTEK